MTQNIISENARIALNQEEYDKKYNSYIKRYEKKKKRHYELVAQIAKKRQGRGNKIIHTKPSETPGCVFRV